MAVKLGGNGGGEDDDLAESHDINVTPMIDVMLVLLIIFMVAAPLATVDVPVNLPQANAQAQPRPDKPTILTLRRDLSLALGGKSFVSGQIPAALDQETDGNKDRPIFLLADKTVEYGEVMRIMNLVRDAGYGKISLVALEAP